MTMKRVSLVVFVLALLALVAYGVGYAQSSGYPLPVTHTIRLTAVGVDAANFQSAFTGVPVWTVSDPTRGTITPEPGGLSATFNPLLPGAASVTVTVDGLSETWAVQVIGPPVAIRIGVGEPTRKAVTP